MLNLNEEGLSQIFLDTNRYLKKHLNEFEVTPAGKLTQELAYFMQHPVFDLRKGLRELNGILGKLDIKAEFTQDIGQLSILDQRLKIQIDLWHEFDKYPIFYIATNEMEQDSAKAYLGMVLECLHWLGYSYLSPDPTERLYFRFFQMNEDPIIVFNSKNEIVITNKSFTDLNIPASFVIDASSDKVESLKATYLIFRSSFEANAENYGMILLINEARAREALGLVDTVSNFYSDLGIITSSIAHELNNPIAGILAGGETLKMLIDDNAPEEIHEGVEALIQSAQRCQELVRLFLSFSRKDQIKSEFFKTEALFENALELLRNRMLEIGTRFHLKTDGKINEWELYCNKALLTMLVYLLLNDMLTTLNKRELIDENHKSPNRVNTHQLQITQQANSLSIELDDLPQGNNFSIEHLGKLIEYLIQMLNIKFEFTGKGFKLMFIEN
jgi:hypothetical protein